MERYTSSMVFRTTMNLTDRSAQARRDLGRALANMAGLEKPMLTLAVELALVVTLRMLADPQHANFTAEFERERHNLMRSRPLIGRPPKREKIEEVLDEPQNVG